MNQLLRRSYIAIEHGFKRLLFLVLRNILNNTPLTQKLPVKSLRRVLLMRYDMIGDMVVTLPMIRYLKMIYPTAEIEVLASENNKAIILHDKNVSQIYTFGGSLLNKLRLLRQLRKRHYDVVFICVLNKATNTGIIANLIGGRAAKKITSFRGEKYSHFFNLQSIVAHAQDSAWDKLLYIVQDAIETPIHPHEALPYLCIPEDSHHAASTKLRQIGFIPKKYILLNLSCRNRRNEWTEEGYRAIIQNTLSQTPYSVLVLSMEKEEALATRLEAMSERVQRYPPTKDILEIAAVIQQAFLLLTPDTGVVHIASAVATPTLGLYVGGTLAHKEWAPYRQAYSRIVLSVNSAFVETITPNEVLPEFSALVQEIEQANTAIPTRL